MRVTETPDIRIPSIPENRHLSLWDIVQSGVFAQRCTIHTRTVFMYLLNQTTIIPDLLYTEFSYSLARIIFEV